MTKEEEEEEGEKGRRRRGRMRMRRVEIENGIFFQEKKKTGLFANVVIKHTTETIHIFVLPLKENPITEEASITILHIAFPN